MVLNQVDPNPILDADNSTIYTAITPPETIAADFLDEHDPLGSAKLSSSSVPWQDSTFIIRSVSSGHVITLLNGQIVLAPPGGRGSIYWACVDNKGWFGFRDIVTGSFLGHDKNGRLCCSAKQQKGWENFHARMTPEGGYLLLMTHFERLWSVGIKMEQGVQKLAKMENGGPDETVWEFIKV